MKSLTSLWTRIGDLNIHARVSSNIQVTAIKPTDNQASIVLIHGLGVSSRYMIPTVVRLASFYHVYALDLPGFGKSSKPSHTLDLAEMADVLADWMQAIGLDKATFLGHSLGTQVVVNFALRHPEKIEKAILIGSTIDARRRTIRQQVGRLLIDAMREPFSLIPIVLGDYLRAGLWRSLQTLRYALADHIEEKVSDINVPIMIVRGECDPLSPQSWNEKLMNLLKNSRLTVIPKAAHAINYSAPDELTWAVLNFHNEYK